MLCIFFVGVWPVHVLLFRDGPVEPQADTHVLLAASTTDACTYTVFRCIRDASVHVFPPKGFAMQMSAVNACACSCTDTSVAERAEVGHQDARVSACLYVLVGNVCVNDTKSSSLFLAGPGVHTAGGSCHGGSMN